MVSQAIKILFVQASFPRKATMKFLFIFTALLIVLADAENAEGNMAGLQSGELGRGRGSFHILVWYWAYSFSTIVVWNEQRSLVWIFAHSYFDFDSPLEKCALRLLINFEHFLNVKVNRSSRWAAGNMYQSIHTASVWSEIGYFTVWFHTFNYKVDHWLGDISWHIKNRLTKERTDVSKEVFHC